MPHPLEMNLASGGVSVEDEVVGGSAGQTGDLVLGGEGDDAGAEGSGRLLALEAEEVGSETGDVGAGHRGTGDSISPGGAANPGGQNVLARGKGIDDRAVVAEGGPGISVGSSTNSEGGGLGSGGGVCGIRVLVSGGNGKEETSGDSVGGSGVYGSGLAATEGHVGDGALGAATGLLIVGSEVDTGNDTGVGAGPLGVEDLDSIQLGLLGYTVRLSADGASNVGAMTIAIGSGAITCVVGEVGSTALEVGVGGIDTGVDDIRAGVGTATVIIDVAGGSKGLGGDTSQTPGSRTLSEVGTVLELYRLGQVGLNNGVLLNVVNEGEIGEDFDNVIGDLGRETLVFAKAVDVLGTLGEDLQGLLDNVLEGIILHLDDVFAGDCMACAGLEHGSTKCQWQDCGDDEFETHDE